MYMYVYIHTLYRYIIYVYIYIYIYTYVCIYTIVELRLPQLGISMANHCQCRRCLSPCHPLNYHQCQKLVESLPGCTYPQSTVINRPDSRSVSNCTQCCLRNESFINSLKIIISDTTMSKWLLNLKNNFKKKTGFTKTWFVGLKVIRSSCQGGAPIRPWMSVYKPYCITRINIYIYTYIIHI